MSEQTYPWNHNNHYHDFLLNHIPLNAVSALDVGCGSGEFARQLAIRCQSVDAVDPDLQAITIGRNVSASFSNLDFYCESFEDSAFPLAHYDFVSVIASLHHMQLAPTLEKMKHLLNPNGTLAILGLYKEETISDLLRSIIAVPINRIYRSTKQQANECSSYQMVTSQPKVGLQAIRNTLNLILPNHQFKHHLFWRYSVIWQKPFYNYHPLRIGAGNRPCS